MIDIVEQEKWVSLLTVGWCGSHGGSIDCYAVTEIKGGLMILDRKRGKLKEPGSVRFGLFCLVRLLTAIVYFSAAESNGSGYARALWWDLEC